MLNIGLIGLGAEWEGRYRPALTHLSHRLRVRAVHTAVLTRAEQIAQEFRCDAVTSLRQMVQRDDIRAILVLDPAWYAECPVRWGCGEGKPMFLAKSALETLERVSELHHMAADRGVTLMPECGLRYTPATNRLRELLATKLGRPVHIDLRQQPVEEGQTPGAGFTQELPLSEWIDWCRCLVGTQPQRFHVREGGPGEGVRVVVEFRKQAGATHKVTAELPPLPVTASGCAQHSTAAPRYVCELHCERGRGWLISPTEIRWECAAGTGHEVLSTERCGTEVMLDHFSRRVVGGLIPVPTLEDIHLARHWQRQAADSLASGQPVELS